MAGPVSLQGMEPGTLAGYLGRPFGPAAGRAGSSMAFTPGWTEPPAGTSEDERLRWAAQQMEALFIEQLWKGMRRTVPRSGMFDGIGTEVFEEMLDQERSRLMAEAGTLGLAKMIYEQMSRYAGNEGGGRTTGRGTEQI
ncbi:MAG: rod-binding protein [Firmicutes bacterium]|nr:rod-binding protein [Bacillota bacterium]